MSIDTLVQAHHKLTFQNNYMLVAQKLGSKLRPYVTEVPCTGEAQSVADLIGTVTAQRRTERARTNIDNPAPRSRRWLVYRDPIETGQYFDKEDEWRGIENPNSQTMRAHAMAIGRGIDQLILGLDLAGAIDVGGLMGPVVDGKRPGGSGVALPAANTTVHGGVGLTIAKLRATRKKLALDNIDLGSVSPVMAIDPSQNDDLLGIVEAASANLNMLEQPHIVEGKVQRLMGFTFIEVNGLFKTGTTRSCPVWLKEKVVLGIWQDDKTDLFNDPHAANTPYGRAFAVMDATRISDEGVHIIECTET